MPLAELQNTVGRAHFGGEVRSSVLNVLSVMRLLGISESVGVCVWSSAVWVRDRNWEPATLKGIRLRELTKKRL